jgi:caffeoyl-CoA O-methyltransferase
MNKQFGNEDQALAEYVSRLYAPEDAVLREIRERSAQAGLPDIQVAALDGRHLEILARLLRARRMVEIGTLGGYSGVCLLRGAAVDGTLDTVEMDPHHAAIAADSFRRAGFADRARIHVGAALEVLPQLCPEGNLDLVFIDADKESYPAYLDWAADRLRPGGAVVADNAFLFGRLADANESVEPMQAFHRDLATGGRFRATVLPTGEGLAVGVRI